MLSQAIMNARSIRTIYFTLTVCATLVLLLMVFHNTVTAYERYYLFIYIPAIWLSCGIVSTIITLLCEIGNAVKKEK